MSDDSWASTKGLSVYNALSMSGRDMSAEDVLAFLRGHWDPEMDLSYVHEGIGFLLRRNFVELRGDLIAIPVRNPNTRAGRPLFRIDSDRDLAMSAIGSF